MVRLLNNSLIEPMQGKPMFELLRNLCRVEEGGTAIEYGLIVALISVVAMVAMSAIGTSLSEMFNIIDNALGGGS